MAEIPLKCSTCEKQVERDIPFFPFCSERCKMADLGAWMNGSYKISRRVDLQDHGSFNNEEESYAPFEDESV